MIKSDNSIKSSEGEPCWGREASPMVRFELADGAWLILPYCDLDFAYAHPSPSSEVLELHFTTHRVRLAGSGLRKIMIAMQKHGVEWVRPALKSERMCRGEGPTWITSIEIEELQSKPSHGGASVSPADQGLRVSILYFSYFLHYMLVILVFI